MHALIPFLFVHSRAYVSESVDVLAHTQTRRLEFSPHTILFFAQILVRSSYEKS